MRIRAIRFRGAKKQKEDFELMLTPLLDVIIIILICLLKNYNASGVDINVPHGITLPYSQSTKINTAGTIVQVTANKIWVDDQVVLDVNEELPSTYDQGGLRIVALYNELVKKKEAVKQIKNGAPNAADFSGRINLVVDKTLKYSFLKKVMHTCADAGFKEYKFVVMAIKQ